MTKRYRLDNFSLTRDLLLTAMFLAFGGVLLWRQVVNGLPGVLLAFAAFGLLMSVVVGVQVIHRAFFRTRIRAQVSIEADKDKYKPGDKATIVVRIDADQDFVVEKATLVVEEKVDVSEGNDSQEWGTQRPLDLVGPVRPGQQRSVTTEVPIPSKPPLNPFRRVFESGRYLAVRLVLETHPRAWSKEELRIPVEPAPAKPFQLWPGRQ